MLLSESSTDLPDRYPLFGLDWSAGLTLLVFGDDSIGLRGYSLSAMTKDEVSVEQRVSDQMLRSDRHMSSDKKKIDD